MSRKKLPSFDLVPQSDDESDDGKKPSPERHGTQASRVSAKRKAAPRLLSFDLVPDSGSDDDEVHDEIQTRQGIEEKEVSSARKTKVAKDKGNPRSVGSKKDPVALPKGSSPGNANPRKRSRESKQSPSNPRKRTSDAKKSPECPNQRPADSAGKDDGISQEANIAMFNQKLPASLQEALMPFQRQGVLFGMAHRGRVLIGDEMGLGKTLQAIGLACVYEEDWPVVVLMPASMRWVWADELEKWLPTLRPGDVKVVKSGADTDGLDTMRFKFILVTYDLFTRSDALQLALQASGCGVCIVDESHYCKNRDAKRSQAVTRLAQACKRCIMLSGTPALNRPAELYPQINALEDGLLGTWSAFTKRHCDGHRGRFGWECRGATHLDELAEKLRSIMIRVWELRLRRGLGRRHKADVLTELPAKRRQQIPLELDRKVTDSMRVELRRLWATPEGTERNRLWGELMQRTASEKTPLAADYVVDLINGGAKALVFGHYHATLDGIETQLARAKIQYVRIDGGVTGVDRQAAVRKFQTDEGVRVALLGLLAAGQGITLTAATTVIFAELHVTPGILVQAEDRAHRIGQTSAVNVHYLCARGTLDDSVWRMISRKLDVVSRTLSGRTDALDADSVAPGTIGDFSAQPGGGPGSGSAPPAELFEFTVGDSLTAKEPPPTDIRSFFRGGPTTGNGTTATPSRGKPAVSQSQEQARSEGAAGKRVGCSSPGTGESTHSGGSNNSSAQGVSMSVGGNCEAAAAQSKGRKRVFVVSDDEDAGEDEPGGADQRIDASAIATSSSSQQDGQVRAMGTSRTMGSPEGEVSTPATVGKHRSVIAQDNIVLGAGLEVGKASEELVVDLTADAVGVKGLTNSTSHKSMSQIQNSSAGLSVDEVQNSASSPDRQTATKPLVKTPSSSIKNSANHQESSPKTGASICDLSAVPDKGEGDANQTISVSSFQVSGNTQRIYVYTDSDGQDCLGSVHGRALQEGGAELPSWANGGVLRALISFHTEWTALRAVERLQLADRILIPPLSRALATIQREAASTAAGSSDGTTRRHTTELPFGECEGLCGWCGRENKKRPGVEGAVGLRFCSVSCSEKFAVCASSSAVRRQLYALEKGVCQLCGVDAHALYTRVKALPQGPERLQAVMETRMKLKGRLDKILKSPQVGDFWQADHIRPVAEGGGEADISGFRTLCTPCHEAETARLLLRLNRRRAAAAAAGTCDIRSFFGGGSAAAQGTGSGAGSASTGTPNRE